MEDGVVLIPLVSVLLGAVIGGGASLFVERARARNSRKAELLGVRREVQLDALDEVHRTIDTFRTVFAHNHSEEDEEADAAQAMAMQAHFLQLDALELQAHRVDVLANQRVAELVGSVPARIRKYFMGIPADLDPGEPVFRAVEIQDVVNDLDGIMSELKTEVRSDLRTAELDAKR